MSFFNMMWISFKTTTDFLKVEIGHRSFNKPLKSSIQWNWTRMSSWILNSTWWSHNTQHLHLKTAKSRDHTAVQTTIMLCTQINNQECQIILQTTLCKMMVRSPGIRLNKLITNKRLDQTAVRFKWVRSMLPYWIRTLRTQATLLRHWEIQRLICMTNSEIHIKTLTNLS